jgi:aspartyl-tRNA(Asn)/glutamyl-tRNA(Gln) amidotransferase subunit B
MPEAMIGLETHVQLNIETKMFCGCSIKNIPEEPNTRCCPTCLGMPGSKPRVNKAAIEAGIKIALALGCKISPEIFFSRKTYFYPDMSKNFQITQYEIPLSKEGEIETLDLEGKKKVIRIRRINLEEDPAKLEHVGGDITTANYVLIDYNRSGIPLCEIVTEPDFSSSKEVRIFLQRLSAILEYLGVFVKGEMSLKTDVNISIKGHERVEIKNITSFGDIEKAIEFEIVRQESKLRGNEEIERETMTWDPDARTTKTLRKKEVEEEYGYIFEPDLTMIEIKKDIIDKIKEKLPELPHQKFERYKKEFKISSELAYSITSDLELAQFYERLAKKIEPDFAASWMNILKKTLYYNDTSLKETKLTEELFLRLLELIKNESVTDRGGELILRKIIFEPEEFNDLAKKFSKIETTNTEEIIDNILKKYDKAVRDYRKGDKKALNFLIGMIAKETENRIDAKTIQHLLEKKLKF